MSVASVRGLYCLSSSYGFGSHSVIACFDGLIPLSKIVQSGLIDDGTTYAISRKIQPTITTYWIDINFLSSAGTVTFTTVNLLAWEV